MLLKDKLERLTVLHNLKAVSRAAGVHYKTTQNMVAGRTRPHRYVVAAIAGALDVDPEWLADDAQDWPPVWKHSEGRVAAVA